MRKLLLGTAMSVAMVGYAAAADMPVYPKAPPPAWSWTGFYIGAQGGAGWGTTEDSVTAVQQCTGGVCGAVFPLIPAGTLKSGYGINGFHAGGTAGFNWQAGRLVFGVEGDISAANIDGSGGCQIFFAASTFTSCHSNLAGFATLTGRLGMTFDHALVYVKAGGAWARFNQDVLTSNGAGFGACGGCLTAAGSVGTDRMGFTVGTGIEYALWGGWSAKVEYDYMDFGTKNISFPEAGPLNGATVNNVFADDRERVHVVRAGVNYRFDWGGARY